MTRSSLNGKRLKTKGCVPHSLSLEKLVLSIHSAVSHGDATANHLLTFRPGTGNPAKCKDMGAEAVEEAGRVRAMKEVWLPFDIFPATQSSD